MKMKIILLVATLFIAFSGSAQQSFRIQKIPRVFKGSLTNSFDRKINDSLTLHVENKSGNYELSILRLDGTAACSCLYKINPKAESLQTQTMVQTKNGVTFKDSTTAIMIFEPVNENCIQRYRAHIAQSSQ
jgi:hypothetical protein